MRKRRICTQALVLPFLLLSSCASPMDSTTGPDTTPQARRETLATQTTSERSSPVSPTPIGTPTLLPPLPRLADPDNPLNSTGPWLSFWIEDAKSDRRLFITNPDGSGMTELHICEDCSWPALSDASPFVAYVRTNLTSIIQASQPPVAELIIVEVPSFQEVHVIDLLGSPGLENVESLGESDLFEVVRLSWPSWSPDGSTIAFSAAIDAPNVDLYSFRVADELLTRLSRGPNHARSPRWSPDGATLLYAEVAKPPIDYEVDDLGVWAVNAESGENQWLFAPNGHHELLDWVDDVHAVTYSHRWDRSSGPELDIRVTDIRTASSEVICNNACDPWGLAIDRQHGLVIFQRTPYAEWYALNANTGKTVQLPDVGGLDPPMWNDNVQGLVFGSPDPWAQADCEGSTGHHFVRADQTLGCTTAEVQALESPSPSGEWSIGYDAVLRKADQVVTRYLDDVWFRKEASDRYDDSFNVVWRPDSAGAFMYKPESLFYVDVPSGSPVLVHDGDTISSLHWIAALE